MGAKHELTESLFTKTMQIQVWRPENERPGRHFVYTSRYLRFFTRLLVQLNDRVNLELLVRRLRRKPQEFYDHAKLWQETVLVYLKLLRRAGKIPEGHEDYVFKSLNHEEFTVKSERLEAYCHSATTESTTLDILKEVIEMKRMNMGLMKVTLIDDLVCDTYAKLYEEIVPQLPEPEAESKPEPQAQMSGGMTLGSMMNAPPGSLQFQTGFPQPTQPSAEPTHTKARNRGVGRREIMRKAELCVNRPVAATIASIQPRAPTTVGVPASPSLNQTVQVVNPPRLSQAQLDGSSSNTAVGTPTSTAPPALPSTSAPATSAASEPPAATAIAAVPETGPTTSRRESLYPTDSDESGSELSEPPEDEGEMPDFDELKSSPVEIEPPAAPMFPNLAKKKALSEAPEGVSTRTASPAEAEAGAEGEDEGDEDGDEGEGEGKDGEGDVRMDD
jgi:hypothetical protein